MRNIIINTNQKKVLKLVVIAILLMLLFPPFQERNGPANVFEGFGFIFHPPRSGYGYLIASIDIWMMQIEFLAILVIGFIFFLINSEQ
jgi:hypothetical protein